MKLYIVTYGVHYENCCDGVDSVHRLCADAERAAQLKSGRGVDCWAEVTEVDAERLAVKPLSRWVEGERSE